MGCAQGSILLGVSGGADSMALLHAAAARGWKPAVCHVHHGLRGAAADRDAAFVERWCSDRRIPFRLVRVETAHSKELRSRGTEAAARTLRRTALERVRAEMHLHCIATAHTRDDLVETILLNILRGCGLSGLVGMHPVEGYWCKPLLQAAHADAVEYCRQHNVQWCQDETNTDTIFRRNAVRLELLPYLRDRFNPSVDAALLRLADIAAAEDAFLKEASAAALQRLMRGDGTLSLSDLLQQPAALQRRIIRAYIELRTGSVYDVEYLLTDAVISAARTGHRVSYTLRGGDWELHCCSGLLEVRSVTGSHHNTYKEYALTVPGVLEWDEATKVVAEETQHLPMQFDSRTAWMDKDLLVMPLSVRHIRPGDLLQPLGMKGHAKVSDILINRKVPREIRPTIPVVCDQSGIVWVGGVCLAERVRLTSTTRSAVRIVLEDIRASG